MSDAWKNLDLEGEGLQSANLKLVQKMKKRKHAYVLLLFFPFGLHRDYLESSLGGWLYRSCTVLFVMALLLGYLWPALVLLAFMSGLALYDIRWIEDKVAAINKALRVQAYKVKPSVGLPKNFRGRYTDEGLDDYLQVKAQERGGHVAPGTDPALNSRSRAPSFAEQEAMLKALAKSKSDRSSN
ncbi:MAG: hypothetical protein ACYCSS_03855 [Sulfuriferula sp.]